MFKTLNQSINDEFESQKYHNTEEAKNKLQSFSYPVLLGFGELFMAYKSR